MEYGLHDVEAAPMISESQQIPLQQSKRIFCAPNALSIIFNTDYNTEEKRIQSIRWSKEPVENVHLNEFEHILFSNDKVLHRELYMLNDYDPPFSLWRIAHLRGTFAVWLHTEEDRKRDNTHCIVLIDGVVRDNFTDVVLQPNQRIMNQYPYYESLVYGSWRIKK